MEKNSGFAPKLARISVLSLATALVGGCNMTGLDFGGELQSISLSGPSVVQVGDTIRLTAAGSVSGLIGMLFLDRLLDARFTTSDATVATIQAFIPPATDTTSFSSVLVTGRKVGRAGITVRARSQSDTHFVDVIAPGP